MLTKEKIREIILQNKEILKRYGVRSIFLFGSYIRNEQRENSDIDFLVDLNKGATLFDLVDLEDRLSGILGKKVSLVSKRGLSKYIGPYILREAEALGEGL